MKIDNRISVGSTEHDLYEGKCNIANTSSSFNSKLKEYEQVNAYEFLSGLRQDIEKQGILLGKTLNINEMRYYKKMITDFLQQAVMYSFNFEKENLTDRRGRRHIYSMVNKVNQKVDELIKQVMEKEKDNIQILKMIDDIRGMLLDLTM